MESKDRIIENALDEVILRTLYDLESSDITIKDSEIKLSELYDSLRFDETFDKAAQEQINCFFKLTIKTTSIEFRHIYLQGAKDCVAAMRILGVIK